MHARARLFEVFAVKGDFLQMRITGRTFPACIVGIEEADPPDLAHTEDAFHFGIVSLIVFLWPVRMLER